MWSLYHFITLIPSIIVMILLSIYLQKKIQPEDEKSKLLVFKIIGCLLVILEIIKQVNALIEGYYLFALPFHFCSMFIFMPLLVGFYTGKNKQTVRNVVAGFMMTLLMVMLIYPTCIYSVGCITNFFEEFGSFHTIVFHDIVLFSLFLMLSLGLVHLDPKKDFKYVIITCLGYCFVGSTLANTLSTNFNNFYRCLVPSLENVRIALTESIGYSAGQFLYVICVAVSTLLGVVVSYYILYMIQKSLTRKIDTKTINQ